MQIIKKKIYDVCVIGSGAAGGFMAKELTEAGAEVLLLEAGRDVKAEQLPIHDWPYELPRHGYNFNKQAALYPDDIGRLEFRGTRIGIDRIRVLGGRTLHWNAACLRFSADDFREKSVNGIEEDWPINYEEIAPFYSYVERLIGFCGTKENLAVLPDGEYFSAPPALRCAESIAKKASAKIGLRMIQTRKALSTKKFGNRPACHYCGHCMDVCDVGAIFTSVNTLLPKAFKTGRLTLRTNALARKVLIDASGRASGVSFIDRESKQEETINARLVVVSCASVESARLLLNSACEKFPRGLANANDLVGRYLTGHSHIWMVGYLKELRGRAPVNDDGATDHSYITRSDAKGGEGFRGGYGVQVQFANQMYPHHAKSVDGFGAGFKKSVKEMQPAMLQMGGYGKVMADKDNRVTINPQKTDPYGIPLPVVNFNFGESDRALFKEMVARMEELYQTAGTELLIGNRNAMSGFASHEVGTCRMGNDSRS